MIPTKEEMFKACSLKHGSDLQHKFSAATVAICGLGGLGSNIAISLARSGIGRLIIIDFDRVDITNLQRQQYKASQVGMYKSEALKENLLEIAPYVKIECYTEKINENNVFDLLKSADIICEAFDNAEEKAMLVNIVFEKFPEKYLVSGSGMAGFDSPNTIKTRRIMKHFYISGDEVSDVNNNIGLFSARVMLCAAHQALTVLRILGNEFEV